ncbi:PREDICTED: uncharacterized protein LOC104737821 [Camelina sativa]|uniref:Uncharacterized protein LOC104737821 n=1 Tax=Camelina sativa TaxID=90675 RepID=A0ABM0VHV9_CAMSA|nr:PREDICTED: uncharacterized protein LOC104737821 [Camelina sativa]
MPLLRRYVFNPTGITRVGEEEYNDQTEPQTRGYIHVNVTASTRVSLNEREHQRSAPLSCSWDLNSCHHVYAGLQNGMVLVFDMRQNKRPLASLVGVTSNPVHTIYHVFHVCLKRRVDGSYSQKQSSTQAIVDTITLPRTAIIDFGEERRQLFASYDDFTRELILQDPSSFTVSQRFALSSPHLLQDVKYAHLNGSGLLGLLTDDRLQLLSN